ncbi:MAG TPA: GDSL-type esterase/lipase family protein [Anaerolineae bacterium]
MPKNRAILFVGILLIACGANPTPSATPATVTPPSLATTPATSLPQATATASATVTAQPSPTTLAAQYTIAAGDTLWDIAVRIGASLDEMILANPNIFPDLLHPGDVINLPSSAPTPAVRPTRVQANAAPTSISSVPISTTNARVARDADQLRLRKGPSTAEAIVTRLAALTPLTILQRSADSAWLEVSLIDGTRGWVMAQYIDVGNAPPLSVDALPMPEPYLSGFTNRAREIFRTGQTMGNHANVFAVIGDSNSASPLYLEPFDHGNYDLGEYGYLQDTIAYFKGSFTYTSVAAVVGFDTLEMLDPARADAARCEAGESPLVCEYRRKRPAVALILIGTNDTMNWQNFEANLRQIIDITIAQGIVPVLFTKGDDLESTKYQAPSGYMNGVIQQLSREYGIPLLDLHQVTVKLSNGGFGSDGFHFNVAPDGRTAFFTGDHMNYGYTIRNLTALQMLDAVRRLILTN